MVKNILKKEIKTLLRGKAPYLLVGLLYLLVIAAFWGGYTSYKKTQGDKQRSTQKFEEEWVSQEANPHSAAHFGTYLFKPNTALELIDKGLSDYMGNTYRVEAHHQYEMNYAAARDNGSEFRFGELTLAFILQLFVPLMIIFLGFSSISKEKENSTLKIIWAQGATSRQLIWGKLWGVYLTTLLICIPLFLILIIAPALIAPTGNVPWLRIGSMLASYLFFYFLIAGIVVWVSARMSSSKASLQVSLWGWVILCVLLPRLFAGIADSAHPLPSRNTFNEGIDRAYAEGLDGNQGRKERSEALKKETLAKYGKDSIENLPINFDGLSMQSGEDYLSKVYDTYAKEVQGLIEEQNTMLGYLGLLDPVVAIRQLSMGYAGTDYLHHSHFHHRAKQYRDDFIRALNMEMAYAEGSRELKYEYKVGNDFFEKMEGFEYQLPPIRQMYSFYILPICALLVWGFILFATLRWGSNLKPDSV
ncbi:MAG: DUF3526 domain-containing protein [Flavobacteriaceae bacterium]|nr:DUF3526 domain-containing protein [Flavobacteriaceae bacterium]